MSLLCKKSLTSLFLVFYWTGTGARSCNRPFTYIYIHSCYIEIYLMYIFLSVLRLSRQSDWLHTWRVHCWGPKEVQCWVWSCLEERLVLKTHILNRNCSITTVSTTKYYESEIRQGWNVNKHIHSRGSSINPRLAVRSPAPQVHVLKCTWARHWTPSCSQWMVEWESFVR